MVMKDKIIQIKDMTDSAVEKLLVDNWSEANVEVVNIINELQIILQLFDETDSSDAEMADVINKWLILLDAILKAVEMQDTIQLSDLLHYDLIQALNYILENVIK